MTHPAPVAAGSGHRGAWYCAAVLGAVLVLVPAGWQVWAMGSGHTGVLEGGSAGRTVTAVEIAAGAATVDVTPRGDQQIGYRADVRWSFGRPVIEESWLGDTLRLTPRCPGDTVSATDELGCSVRLAVTVPIGVPVKISGTSGRIGISGLEGTVDAQVQSGSLHLSGLRGPLRADVDSGTLRAVGLASRQADVRAGAGRADVRFVTPPDRVTGRVGAGRLDLTLPAATRYRVTSHVGWGRCEVDDSLRDPSAPRTLDLSVESGTATAGHRPPAD
ncbi:hypothetical protein ACFZBM_09965 [Streptomyces lavendulae]|uniref:hypothetical protein n=1 Tax=Streptomyces lavendulae TaxID=1914 RepID=UPI0036EEFB0A